MEAFADSDSDILVLNDWRYVSGGVVMYGAAALSRFRGRSIA